VSLFQVSADKEFAAWQHDMELSQKLPTQAHPTVFRWPGGGKDVCLAGSFDNWHSKIPLAKRYAARRSHLFLPVFTFCQLSWISSFISERTIILDFLVAEFSLKVDRIRIFFCGDIDFKVINKELNETFNSNNFLC